MFYGVILTVLLFTLTSFELVTFAQNEVVQTCHRLLSEQEDSTELNSETAVLIQYWESLHQSGILSTAQIKKIAIEAEQGFLSNPFSLQTLTSAEYYGFLTTEEILNKLNNKALKTDLLKVKVWAQRVLRFEAKIDTEKKQTGEEVKSLGFKISFVKIPKGFLELESNHQFGQIDEEILKEMTGTAYQAYSIHPKKLEPPRRRIRKVVFDKDIELMNAPVTQSQWLELMGYNPSQHVEGADTVNLKTETGEIKIQPNHPVEFISWLEALIFANRLSIANGLRPVYKFTGVDVEIVLKELKKRNTSFAFDELKIGIDSFDGTLEGTEGYRLPTSLEYKYILHTIFSSLDFLGENPVDTQKYFWTSKNSQLKTQPVNERDPLIYDGSKIYNLLGNVSFCAADNVGSDLFSAKDSFKSTDLGFLGTSLVALLGTDFFIDLSKGVKSLPMTSTGKGPNSRTGLRLIRTIHK